MDMCGWACVGMLDGMWTFRKRGRAHVYGVGGRVFLRRCVHMLQGLGGGMMGGCTCVSGWAYGRVPSTTITTSSITVSQWSAFSYQSIFTNEANVTNELVGSSLL